MNKKENKVLTFYTTKTDEFLPLQFIKKVVGKANDRPIYLWKQKVKCACAMAEYFERGTLLLQGVDCCPCEEHQKWQVRFSFLRIKNNRFIADGKVLQIYEEIDFEKELNFSELKPECLIEADEQKTKKSSTGKKAQRITNAQ